MTQHTPGPWTPHEQGVHPYPFVCGPAEPTEHGEESFLVAYATGVNAEANVNLIAAAPDMLAALQNLVGEWPEGEGMKLGDRIQQARAAIDKATGSALTVKDETHQGDA